MSDADREYMETLLREAMALIEKAEMLIEAAEEYKHRNS